MALTLKDIYKTLLNHFGSQNWWPAETPFEVIVGAILTQNTAWKNVEKSINLLKQKGLLLPEPLLSMADEELAAYIKSSGFYNLKAKRLKNFLAFFQRYNFDLDILRETPSLREKLLSIEGIGKETADSIMLYAMNIPVFVVDAYTKRIFFRLGFINSEDASYDDVQHLFHTSLTRDVKIFNEYHALIVEMAKSYCKKKPCCNGCPLVAHCHFTKQKDKGFNKDCKTFGVSSER